jgi:hypothetical protein
VIAVRVRVDHEPDRFAGQALQCCKQLLGCFRDIGVDHDDAVIAHGDHDVALVALQHRDAAAERSRGESGSPGVKHMTDGGISSPRVLSVT